jgi:hypothetical protein
LYEAIHGETPFASANYNALLRLIVETEPATLRELGAADEALSGIVARGMSKNPGDRFGSLGSMGKALALWLAEQGIGDDVCGISLETKWLTRQTDPNGAGRLSSRPSVPDGWFEPTSGIRNVGRTFATAPTLQASRPAGTPVSLAPVETAAQPRSTSFWTAALALALGTVIAGGWLAFGRNTDEGSSEHTSAASPQAPPAVAEVHAVPLTSSVAQGRIAGPTNDLGMPRARASAAVPVTAQRKAADARKPGAAATRAPPTEAPAATEAESKGSKSERNDLIAPY